MKKFYVYILLSLLSAYLSAQTYNIEQYTVRDGLLHSFVNDIIQDRKGYIWIATGGGLSKFDGINFTNYTKKDGLSDYRLLSLAEDDYGNIWIGSSNGLNVFSKDTIYSFSSGIRNVFAMQKAMDGQMWVVSNAGIKKIGFIKGKFKVTDLNFSVGKLSITDIFQDRNTSTFLLETSNKHLIVGANNHIYIYAAGKVKKPNIPTGLKLYSGCKLPGDKIVLGTSNGLYILKNDSITPLPFKKLNGFHALKIKYHNLKFWMIGYWGNPNKLFVVSTSLSDENFFLKISNKNGMIDKPTSLFIDHEKNVWIGSVGGLSVLKNKAFVTYTTKDGLAGNKIWALLYDSTGNIWVGTIGQGLSVITKNQIFKFDSSSGLPDLYIASIFQLKGNNYLIGTGKKGLLEVKFFPETGKCIFKRSNTQLGKDSIRIDAILKDKYGILWVGSSKGLFFSNNNGKSFSYYPLSDRQVFVQKLHETKEGNILVGTRSSGLFEILPSGKVKQLLGQKERFGVSSICTDIYGNVWISSLGRGLALLDSNLHWINENEGLTSSLIYILQPDHNGNLWIGSNLGLDKFDINSYIKHHKVNIRHYDSYDGLLSVEMNLNGSFEDKDGNLYFASNHGLVKYDYHYDLIGRVPPILNLVNVKLHLENVDWKRYAKKIDFFTNLPVNPILPYNENHIAFEFIGISFKNPKKIQYSWKLQGFDKKWTPPATVRQAVYSNLPPGKYTFLLKAANSDGVWTALPVKFSFTISPPFWVRWWFILLAIIFFVFVVFTYIRLRTKSLIKRQKELEYQIKLRTEKINLQKEELEAQIALVSKQKLEIERIHKQISSSIEYAKRIQESALPDLEQLQKMVNDAMVLFKPRDVVSGDFYWWRHMGVENKVVITVADCTGHGVPGAFMSMLGISFLREIITKEYISHPGVILRKLRKEIINTLRQKDKKHNQKDGMDMALISINLDTLRLQYAGANNPLYLVTSEKLEFKNEEKYKDRIKITEFENNNGKYYFYELKPDKMPIAIYERMDTFVTFDVMLPQGTSIYMASDGYADQFGGPLGKKFKYKPFKELLMKISHLPMNKQKEALEKTLSDWMNNYEIQQEQIDDITIIGLKV